MFVVILEFPKINPTQEQNFLDWFELSNQKFQDFDGFISRKLLTKKDQDTDGSKFVGILELRDRKAYVDLHTSNVHKETFLGLVSILDDIPTKKFYEVVIPTIGKSKNQTFNQKFQRVM
jgi:heme-degrading monooxygenase HmoA